MRYFGTIDLETDPFQRLDPNKPGRIPKAFAGAVYIPGKGTGWDWSQNCCRFIVRECCQVKYEQWIFYAHNGGKFDFHFILSELLELYAESDLEIMCIGARIVKIKTPTCEFRDSFCIIPKALKNIVYAAKEDIDFKKMEASVREQHKEEILKYLKQDVIGLYDALEKFFAAYGQEITLASTCYKVLKKDFHMPNIRTDERFDSKFRSFYFAGRVQFFALGKFGKKDKKKRYSVCDINSAFPWAMRFNHWFCSNPIVTNEPPTNNKENCFYEVTCDSDGILPFRSSKGGVEFPSVKQTRFFASGWELFTGIELGKVTNYRIHTVFVPRELRNFADYINHFYALKKKADEENNQAERDFNKLFMNGAYGKFALNPREFRDVKITQFGEVPEPKIIKRKNNTQIVIHWEHSYDDMDRCLSFWQMPSHIEGAGKPMLFNNVATAASITGCVRAFLARSMHTCRDVLYCDTDSIIAGDTSALELGNELGQWKLEKECDALWIAGKKLYAAHDYRGAEAAKKEWKTASKGVRLTAKEICEVAEGEEKSYSFEAPNYSVFSGVSFTKRTVRRDDMRKKR